MIVNIVFLIIVAVSLIRTASYGVYCTKKSVIGGIGVFILALGEIFCGLVIWIVGIK